MRRFLLVLIVVALILVVSHRMSGGEAIGLQKWLIYGAANVAIFAAYAPAARYAPERIGRRQVGVMAAGALLYGILSWATNIIELPNVGVISLRIGVVFPVFMGFSFGPAVGFVTGAVGNNLGDVFSGWGAYPVWNVGNGLMGFIAGFYGLAAQRQPITDRLFWLLNLLLAGSMVELFLFSGTAVANQWGVVFLLLLVATIAIYWGLRRRYPMPAATIVWGAWGVIIGMGFASLMEIWTLGLTPAEALFANFFPIAGTNLVFTTFLLPLIFMTWE